MNNYSIILSLRKAIHDKLKIHSTIVRRSLLVYKGPIDDVSSFFSKLGFNSSQFRVLHDSLLDCYYICVKV